MIFQISSGPYIVRNLCWEFSIFPSTCMKVLKVQNKFNHHYEQFFSLVFDIFLEDCQVSTIVIIEVSFFCVYMHQNANKGKKQIKKTQLTQLFGQIFCGGLLRFT